MIAGFEMSRDIPPELLAEAKSHPDGWVYEIDPGYGPNGRVPMSGIVRAWKVSSAGEPTG
jgi:hypothetical protein